MALRRELLIRRLDGGLVEVLDPLSERRQVLSEEALAADPTLAEGPLAERLRAIAWATRSRPPEPVFPLAEADWSLARELPEGVRPAWREAETWRRLAEERIADGRPLLVLRDFTTWRPPTGPEERVESDLVRAWRTRLEAPLMDHPALRHLAGAALGTPLLGDIDALRWRMEPGDGLSAHRVGTCYAATFTLGLNPRWRAADGGAIAFGDPATGEVRTRWLPQAGDLLIFAGGAWCWHWVEAPRRERHTFTGWWRFAEP